MTADDDVRVRFDAEVTFRNGGGLQVQGFRLDAPRPDLTADEIGALFVRRLGLLMVDEVRLSEISTIREQHKGSRGVDAGTAQKHRLVELDHPIEDGMITYPGLPGPQITDHLTREASRAVYAPGTELQIGRINMVGNTSTYLDTPFHRFADGRDLAGVGLPSVADIDGLVVRIGYEGTDPARPGRGIGAALFAPFDVTGRAMLIHTGWERHWRTEQYGNGHPYLLREAVEWLVAERPALVGIDSVNIDDTADGTRPAHTFLLEAGIPIVEHLCGLDQLPANGFRFHAAPPRVVGMGTFPVRAYAVIDA